MIQEVTAQVKNTFTEMLRNVHTAIPGKIVKYYPDKCEAEILPYGKFQKPNGEYMDYPQLNHVPILFQQSMARDFKIVYPIQPGDECLVLTQEQTLDIWRGSGATSDNDLRFDFTNAVAIMGLFAQPQERAAEAQEKDRLIIEKNDHRVHIDPDEIFIRFNEGVHILLNEAGITITAPHIRLKSDTTLSTSEGNTTIIGETVYINPDKS